MDGSYLYRKYRSFTDAGEQGAMPGPPSRPLTGWKSVSEETYRSIASSIPLVTSGEPRAYFTKSMVFILIYCYYLLTYIGLVYTYLVGHVGHTGDQGAFRALTHGYTHWAYGRLEEMEVNVSHPAYCHVHCKTKPSMRTGLYHVYFLLGREGELATICSATCECAAG